ncbi:rod shape-determining protein MreC [Halodesulfovibrio sp.]|jgi:rod shape-determining protein MreC|uniref:rod shape-determining protein MreC n=1 Tax=Halodesulfovibrio sp. TaxID=1912772 RepID=UPI0025F097A2|nr:rod shape-determining protein MreC [Halodesulfovibrio sp.]MCT4535986.1 rod shape-determining protein MreC [Halodesulfovibrio sp.]
MRSGAVDRFAANTGLEFTGAVLKPGKWVVHNTTTLWDEYIHLQDVQQENVRLLTQVKDLSFELAAARENVAELKRLRALMHLSPPPMWSRVAARVLSYRIGVQAELDSIILDKGYMDGAGKNTPVVTHEGVVGRIIKAGPTTASALLLTDMNSRIAAISSKNRTRGLLVGSGNRDELLLKYVPINALLEEGELLVTSGLAGAYPKGLPIARIVSIGHSDISLFKTVKAIPLASLSNLEEIILLQAAPAVAEAEVTPQSSEQVSSEITKQNATN